MKVEKSNSEGIATCPGRAAVDGKVIEFDDLSDLRLPDDGSG